MLSKAFSKSMKTICRSDRKSWHCSMIILSELMWSVHDEPALNPACSASIVEIKGSFIRSRITLATVPLEHSSRVNSEWYTTICLPNVFGEIRKTNKRRRIIIDHSNASSHTSAQIGALLTVQNVEFKGHPPHSPDLAPNDFSLLPHIKKKCVVNNLRHQKVLLEPCL